MISESGNGSKASSAGNTDPFADMSGGGNAPLILDMTNIPNPADFDEGAVWQEVTYGSKTIWRKR